MNIWVERKTLTEMTNVGVVSIWVVFKIKSLGEVTLCSGLWHCPNPVAAPGHTLPSWEWRSQSMTTMWQVFLKAVRKGSQSVHIKIRLSFPSLFSTTFRSPLAYEKEPLTGSASVSQERSIWGPLSLAFLPAQKRPRYTVDVKGFAHSWALLLGVLSKSSFQRFPAH